ncbi:glycosyltransferase [bacterium]|nr:glycosyltransferase [bacterium]
MNSVAGKKIHIVSTVNGQVNEGMRNVATHIARAFEKNNEVRYSGLKDILSIVRNSCSCDVTMVFARANKLVYWLSRIIGFFSKNLWIVCVQKPDDDFAALTKKHPLKAGYLTIVEKDLDAVAVRPGFRKKLFDVGIKSDKFSPVDKQRQTELKKKYGFDPDRLLAIHVGHCSAGRGLEDFALIKDADKMVVASGMFENAKTVKTLEDYGVKIHKGYLEHVEEIYQMADVYIFPTHSTEFVISIPLSVMEALSCGVPVVGYQDFSNLSAISAEDDAILLIDDKSELNAAVICTAAKKRDKSYLKIAKTWEQVATDVLNVVGRD